MTDPTIVRLMPDEDIDKWWLDECLERGRRLMAKNVPARFQDAVADLPEVRAWVTALVDEAKAGHRTVPSVMTGPSLMLIGTTGSGKTYQAYGAMRALSVCGASAGWTVITAADMYAALRPRHRVDSEEEFDRFARTGVLVLDDLGAAKGTEWNEEINYRLINYRYEHRKPTLITSNVPPKNLGAVLGERVASRLTEMTTRVVLKGADRRLAS